MPNIFLLYNEWCSMLTAQVYNECCIIYIKKIVFTFSISRHNSTRVTLYLKVFHLKVTSQVGSVIDFHSSSVMALRLPSDAAVNSKITPHGKPIKIS